MVSTAPALSPRASNMSLSKNHRLDRRMRTKNNGTGTKNSSAK
jgi:hypothetical protein